MVIVLSGDSSFNTLATHERQTGREQIQGSQGRAVPTTNSGSNLKFHACPLLGITSPENLTYFACLCGSQRRASTHFRAEKLKTGQSLSLWSKTEDKPQTLQPPSTVHTPGKQGPFGFLTPDSH